MRDYYLPTNYPCLTGLDRPYANIRDLSTTTIKISHSRDTLSRYIYIHVHIHTYIHPIFGYTT